jgi:glycosyltransferase involved in cell wall biosynthesis
MFEAESLPRRWVAKCNEMDEIWVPSAFNVETFSRAGVSPKKLHVIPECMQAELYDLAAEPLELEGVSGFVFLAVFGWARRKGWDVLVRAYLEEFEHEEAVTLALLVVPVFTPMNEIVTELKEFITHHLGRDPAKSAPIVLLDFDPGTANMPRLYRAADAYVLPSRGEGWGRPYMEAMAMGLPTIGTGWSGNTEFMNDENSYLLDYELVEVSEPAWREFPFFRGQRWAEPSHEHLRTLMRQVVERPDETRAKGARARKEVLARCSWKSVSASVVERLEAANAGPRMSPRPRRALPSVRWEGPLFGENRIAQVNRELCRALVGARRVALDVAPEDDPGSPLPIAAAALVDERHAARGPADVHVRHSWPPNTTLGPADASVLFLPHGPERLGQSARDVLEGADEVWVPTQAIERSWLQAGLDASRAFVIPLGVNPLLFHPDVAPAPSATKESFTFLAFAADDADSVLEAFLRSFRRDEEVCLVIAGPTDPVPSDRASQIRLLPAPARYEDRPALYAACDCLVQAAHETVFPLAEAIACGRPAVVQTTSRPPELAPGTEPALFLAGDRRSLGDAMRRAFENGEQARTLAMRASASILQGTSWKRSAETVADRVEALVKRRRRRILPIARGRSTRPPRRINLGP